MARFSVPQISEFPYHITARILNRLIFPIPISWVWEIFQDELYWMHKKYDLKILSFVLMPNHFHLIAETQTIPIGKILNELIANTSKQMNHMAKKINQNWGSRTYKTQITNRAYYLNVYRYVYQNPIRAGLCNRVEEYPYSTLYGLLGRAHLLIPVVEDSILFGDDLVSTLDWLNTYQGNVEVEHIRKGLRFKEFRVAKDRYRGCLLLQPDAPPLQK